MYNFFVSLSYIILSYGWSRVVHRIILICIIGWGVLDIIIQRIIHIVWTVLLLVRTTFVCALIHRNHHSLDPVLILISNNCLSQYSHDSHRNYVGRDCRMSIWIIFLGKVLSICFQICLCCQIVLTRYM